MSGCIDLEYPFELSWLWETDPDTIWVSMIIVAKEERNKGHTSKLLDDLMKKYKRVIVPTPSKRMIQIVEKRGFVHIPDYEDSVGTIFVLDKRTESEEGLDVLQARSAVGSLIESPLDIEEEDEEELEKWENEDQIEQEYVKSLEEEEEP